MRAYHFLPLAVLLSLTLVASAFAQSNIRWTNNLPEAQQMAQRDGRLILIHFYANSCGPCRKLEHDVFPRTDVAASMMKNYVPVMIDAERFRDVAAHYQIDRFPMDVITDAGGRVVYRTVTPQDPIRYIQLLDGVARDHRFATPGYNVASRSAAGDPSRIAGDTYQRPQPRNQDRQNQFSPSAPPMEQRSYGGSYGTSMPPGPAAYGTARGYEGRDVPNRSPRDSEYGPRYASQAPNTTPPQAPTYTSPPTPRETYNPNITSPNSLSAPDSTLSQTPQYQPQTPQDQGRGGSPLGTGFGRTQAPPTPSRTSGWQAEPPQNAERGTLPDNSNMGQPSANPGRSLTEGRQPPQFASAPVAPQAKEWPLALDGFCPVTLAAEEKWQQGDPQWGARHRGRTYLFASQRYQQMFMADPDRYSPMLSGYDPVRYIERDETVPGLRKHGMWYNGKMYLFADEASLDRFWSSPDYFSQKAHDIMMHGGR